MVAQLSLVTSVLLASSTSTSAQPTSTALTSTITTTSIPSSFSISTGPINSQNFTLSSIAKPQTTVSLFNACAGSAEFCSSFDKPTYYGAVLSADASKTIYAYDCAASANTTSCWKTPMTVTQGLSVFARVDVNGPTPVTVSCNILSISKSAVCEEKQTAGPVGVITAASAGATGLAAANSVNASVITTTLSFNSSQIHYNSLVITKGVEKLSSTSTMATNTPVAPTSIPPSPSMKSGAGSFASAPSVAGLVALLFAFFAF